MKMAEREKKLNEAMMGCALASGFVGGAGWSWLTGRSGLVLCIAIAFLVVEVARAAWHYRKLP